MIGGKRERELLIETFQWNAEPRKKSRHVPGAPDRERGEGTTPVTIASTAGK